MNWAYEQEISSCGAKAVLVSLANQANRTDQTCFPGIEFIAKRTAQSPRSVYRHIQALERAKGNQTRAATLLGLNRDQIRYRIEKFGLSKA